VFLPADATSAAKLPEMIAAHARLPTLGS
jgi:phosphoribosylcarboxyaminoimidazole (NCAIR) mutase